MAGDDLFVVVWFVEYDAGGDDVFVGVWLLRHGVGGGRRSSSRLVCRVLCGLKMTFLLMFGSWNTLWVVDVVFVGVWFVAYTVGLE